MARRRATSGALISTARSTAFNTWRMESPTAASIWPLRRNRPWCCATPTANAARTTAAGNRLTAGGNLANGLQYETAVQVVNSGGRVTASADGVLHIENADALTILVAAGTNYVADRARGWRGDAPRERIAGQLRAAAAMPYPALRVAHLADYWRLFRRVSLSLGTGAPDLPTDERLVRYREGAADAELEALFFQFGRYLLISSSRPVSYTH